MRRMRKGDLDPEVVVRLWRYGREWEDLNQHRLYITDLPGLYGLEVTRYANGVIARARWRGAPIGPGRASSLWATLAAGTLWVDLEDCTWHHEGLSQRLVRELQIALWARVVAVERAEATRLQQRPYSAACPRCRRRRHLFRVAPEEGREELRLLCRACAIREELWDGAVAVFRSD
jgi:hypothetical protein